MDIYTILMNIGGSGVLLTFVTAFVNRKINRATFNNSNADYAGKIIEQADDRVNQYKDDMERLRAERGQCQEECKGQRKAKQEWRGKYEESLSRIHTLELNVKELEGKLAEADWHRCEVNGCHNRIPPRTRSKTE